MPGKQPKQLSFFQPLTYIRQIGTKDLDDETTVYTFLAQVQRALPPVMITLQVNDSGEMHIQAQFNEALRYRIPDEFQHAEGRHA